MTKQIYRQSAIKDFLRCGLYYEFKHVIGLPTQPNPSMTVGSSVDHAVNQFFVRKLQAAPLPTEEELLDVAATEFDRLSGDTLFKDENAGEYKDEAVRMTAFYVRHVAASIEPETIQEEFIIETDADFSIKGQMDLVDRSGFVRDLKVTRNSATAKLYTLDGLQPSLYTWAYEQLRRKPAAGFKFDVLIRNKTPLYHSVAGEVTRQNHEFAFKTIQTVHKALHAGIALPAPEGSYYCKAGECPFWDRCKGRKS